ncbi:hypothetical protein [Haloparvum sp. PAK95]|uniref:hypothetical protein n=1 Tax=Haloparvum sp. PAK95 TaxID=3418962 RepID=UPI003D2F0E82
MHSEATDRESRTVAIEGLARDVVGYPVAVLAFALLVGQAAGVPIAAVLAMATFALGGLSAAVVTRDDLAGDVVQAYVGTDATPQPRVSRAGVALRARVTAVLLSTVGWAGAVVVALALA